MHKTYYGINIKDYFSRILLNYLLLTVFHKMEFCNVVISLCNCSLFIVNGSR